MKKAVQLHRKDRLDAAVEIYKDVLEIKPGFIPAIGMLGAALGQMSQFDASVKLLQEAIKKNQIMQFITIILPQPTFKVKSIKKH